MYVWWLVVQILICVKVELHKVLWSVTLTVREGVYL